MIARDHAKRCVPMQFKLTSLVALATFTGNALAITYRGYASSVSCSGSSFYCSDGGAVCCSLPTGYGLSVAFENLPAGTQGQGYTGGSCSNFLFDLYGPGTKCWNGGGSKRATNINWFHSPYGRSIAISDRADEDGSNCTEPVAFEYETPEGTSRIIKVPTEKGSGEKVAALYLEKNFAGLAAYEDL